MKLHVNWRTALKAIVKNKKRSILTMVGIIIGIAAVIAILSVGRGFEKDTMKSLQLTDPNDPKVILQFQANSNSLDSANMDYIDAADVHNLEQLPGVTKVDYVKFNDDTNRTEILVRGNAQNKQYDLVRGATDRALMFGRNLTQQDNETLNRVMLMDSVTAKAIFGTAKAALQKGFELKGQIYQVVGIFEGVETDNMFDEPHTNLVLPRKSYERFSPKKTDHRSVELSLEKGTKMGPVATKAIKMLKKQGSKKELGAYQVVDTANLSTGIGDLLGQITLFVSAVAAISLFIAGVGVMNMMYISVSERTREIGIRRAMGATRGAIRTQFLLEGMTLTLIGGFIGYLLGMLIAYGIGTLMNITISLDLFTVLLAVGVSSGIGLIFSVMPASEAAKKDLIDILR